MRRRQRTRYRSSSEGCDDDDNGRVTVCLQKVVTATTTSWLLTISKEVDYRWICFCPWMRFGFSDLLMDWFFDLVSQIGSMSFDFTGLHWWYNLMANRVLLLLAHGGLEGNSHSGDYGVEMVGL